MAQAEAPEQGPIVYAGTRWKMLPPGWMSTALPLDITIRAVDAPEYGGVRLFVQDAHGRAATLVWDDIAPEGEYPSACYLDYRAAQTLLESLLRCGVKPCGCCGEGKGGG